MKILSQYFDFNSAQKEKINALFPLFIDWNSKINLVSRKDIQNLEVNHFLHALSIQKWIAFKEGSRVIDLGTGGGLPGILLAIMNEKVHFDLVDARSKKIMVVKDLIEQLGIKNAKAYHSRAEEMKKKYDFVVTRAVASIDKLQEWSQKIIASEDLHGLPNGIIALKGGNLKEELSLLNKSDYYEIKAISDYFKEPFFETKNLLYLQM